MIGLALVGIVTREVSVVVAMGAMLVLPFGIDLYGEYQRGKGKLQ